MMPSRGMGAINPSKMPGKKEITRTDDPNKVAMYKRGGTVKRMDEGGETESPDSAVRLNIPESKQSGPSVKPTHIVANKDYKSVGAKFSSGDIPVGEKGTASFGAETSVSTAKGQRAKAMVDQLQADYRHELDKNTSLGTSFSASPRGDKRVMVALNKSFADGGNVWDTPNPAKKHKKLSPAKKAKAKAAAKVAGRPYPNLIDNMRAAKNG